MPARVQQTPKTGVVILLGQNVSARSRQRLHRPRKLLTVYSFGVTYADGVRVERVYFLRRSALRAYNAVSGLACTESAGWYPIDLYL